MQLNHKNLDSKIVELPLNFWGLTLESLNPVSMKLLSHVSISDLAISKIRLHSYIDFSIQEHEATFFLSQKMCS